MKIWRCYHWKQNCENIYWIYWFHRNFLKNIPFYWFGAPACAFEKVLRAFKLLINQLKSERSVNQLNWNFMPETGLMKFNFNYRMFDGQVECWTINQICRDSSRVWWRHVKTIKLAEGINQCWGINDLFDKIRCVQ